MKHIGLLLVFAACGGWTKQDTLLELSFAGETAIDWHETRTITYYCNEANPIIGQCGERVSPDIYMPVTIVLHAVVSVLLPPKLRTIWQGVSIGAELNMLWINYEQDWSSPPTVVEGGHIVPYVRGTR